MSRRRERRSNIKRCGADCAIGAFIVHVDLGLGVQLDGICSALSTRPTAPGNDAHSAGMGRELPYTEAVDELMEVFREYHGEVFRGGKWSGTYNVRCVTPLAMAALNVAPSRAVPPLGRLL